MKNTLLVLAALFLFTVSALAQHCIHGRHCTCADERQRVIYYQLKADLRISQDDYQHHRRMISPRLRHYYTYRDMMRIENLKEDIALQRKLLRERGIYVN